MKSLKVAAACLAFATACPVHAQPKPISGDVLHMQVLLDRLGFAPGVVDGHEGLSLTKALKGFQEARELKVTGKPDPATRRALSAYRTTPALMIVTLTPQLLAGRYVGPLPEDPAAQARLPVMGYAKPVEALAERFHTTPETLAALNPPGTRLDPGVKLRVPNLFPVSTAYPADLKPEWRATLLSLNVSADQPRADRVVVDKSDGVLRVLGEDGKLLAQFPATMGSRHDPLPIGTWKIQGTSYNPPFHYNPDLFWDADANDEKQLLKPGPNGPVGVVWMDLNKPHYGIHGTPNPETIGRSESHGCIRLSNWDAARLATMVKPGTTAVFRQ